MDFKNLLLVKYNCQRFDISYVASLGHGHWGHKWVKIQCMRM